MTSPRTFEAVCEELDRRRRVALGFERIEALLRFLGRPERALRHVVQVVGTNGKGTTAVALAAALEETGHPCGAYLSPHVLSYTERVMVGGSPVSEETFAAAMGDAIEVADEHGVPATQFELLTAGALTAFRDAGLSWAVLEAGLGARYDATSVVEPEAIVLTNVALDHMQYLGETVEEIAREKLASLRPGTTLLLGTSDARIVEIARETVRNVGARLVEQREQEESRQAASRAERNSATPYSLLPTPRSEATYLARDVGLGFRAAEVLLGRGLSTREREETARCVKGALPGRFEEHEVRGVPVVVDGGHNPEALGATLGAVRARYGDRPLGVVFGVLKDKDAGAMLSLIEKEACILVLTRPMGAGERAARPATLALEHDPRDAGGGRADILEDPGVALTSAVERVRGMDGVVLVTGSFHTAAGVLGGLRGGGLG